MAETRRAFDMIFPSWTASDPHERLGPRVESRLRLIARILDNITALLIKDHANREIRTAAFAPKTAQSFGPTPLQKMQEVETRLMATYPRLRAEATIKEVLTHVSDLSTYEYWGNLCSDPNSVSGPTKATAVAVGNLRGECLDVYQCIWTKLEEQDAKEILGASDAIRFRLLSLESLFGYYKVGYQTLPRRSLNPKSSKPANSKSTSSAAPVIGITTVVIFSTFIPLGFAWSYAESKTKVLPDMDLFFLIQNIIMQLLGIFITIYPIWSSKKPSKRPWDWALGFTIVGSICSLGSLPLYCYLPTFWSGFASFAGNVAQISTSVQLVLLATSHSGEGKGLKES